MARDRNTIPDVVARLGDSRTVARLASRFGVSPEQARGVLEELAPLVAGRTDARSAFAEAARRSGLDRDMLSRMLPVVAGMVAGAVASRVPIPGLAGLARAAVTRMFSDRQQATAEPEASLTVDEFLEAARRTRRK